MPVVVVVVNMAFALDVAVMAEIAEATVMFTKVIHQPKLFSRPDKSPDIKARKVITAVIAYFINIKHSCCVCIHLLSQSTPARSFPLSWQFEALHLPSSHSQNN
jgi:hypothetical protein